MTRQSLALKARERMRRLAPVRIAFCACGHIDYVHAKSGEGPCEGYHGDGRVAWPCDCQRFEKEQA